MLILLANKYLLPQGSPLGSPLLKRSSPIYPPLLTSDEGGGTSSPQNTSPQLFPDSRR